MNTFGFITTLEFISVVIVDCLSEHEKNTGLYLASDGRRSSIPVGPCLVEEIPGAKVEIIWGANGQNSTTLPQEDMRSAEQSGLLLLLD